LRHFVCQKLVLQPTTLCNLNCGYCYLPHRAANHKMSPAITQRLATEVPHMLDLADPLAIIWHGGEPLACGYRHFSSLILPLSDLEKRGAITHSVQTNATLLNNQWCDFFIRHQFQVGISIDGPVWANESRVDWAGASTYSRTMRGIAALEEHCVPYTVIAVVGQRSLGRATELYDFFSKLNCASLGINIEEEEGANREGGIRDTDAVHLFWEELYSAWQTKPTLRIREFDNVLGYAKSVIDGNGKDCNNEEMDIFPTIAWDGDVVVLSPELLGADCPQHENFVVGNMYKESLNDILHRAKQVSYVRDFERGVDRCRAMCAYFSFCGGGQASNKYYELGMLDGTETSFCRNTRQSLLDAVIARL